MTNLDVYNKDVQHHHTTSMCSGESKHALDHVDNHLMDLTCYNTKFQLITGILTHHSSRPPWACAL